MQGFSRSGQDTASSCGTVLLHIALSTAAGRSLQQSWDQALKQGLQVVEQAARQVFGQVADGVASQRRGRHRCATGTAA